MLRRQHFKLVPLIAALILAGCGGGGSDSTTSTTPPAADSSGGSGSGTGTTPTTPTTPTTTLGTKTALADGSTVGSTAVPLAASATPANGKAVGGLSCGAAGANYGYTHLSIIQDGTQLTVPANIGVMTSVDMANADPSTLTPPGPAGCVYPLHTDDASGKIRVDASTTAPTLGQFFAIWGEPLSATSVAGISNRTVTAFINDGGTLTPFSGDPSTIELKPGREITLVAGNVPSTVPTYEWSGPPPLSTDPADKITLNDTPVGTVTQWADGDTASGGQGADVQGPDNLMTCGVSENFHIHTHLAIYKDGKMLVVPKNIGIAQKNIGGTMTECAYNIHAHDASGVLHLETPAPANFTLGDAFAVWGQPLTATNVAGLTDPSIKFFINDNGDVREYVGDPAKILLRSHEAITIQIGTPLTKLPTYFWSSEPQQ